MRDCSWKRNADHCGTPGGLEWVRDRLAMYPPGIAEEVSNANNQ